MADALELPGLDQRRDAGSVPQVDVRDLDPVRVRGAVDHGPLPGPFLDVPLDVPAVVLDERSPTVCPGLLREGTTVTAPRPGPGQPRNVRALSTTARVRPRLGCGSMPGEHVFVDESKRGAYVVAAVVIAAGDVGTTRAAVKRAAAELPGTRRRVHFQTESDAVRRKFLATVGELPITARIYTARERTERASREMILTRLVGDLVVMGARSLVLERDESLMAHDELRYDPGELSAHRDTSCPPS